MNVKSLKILRQANPVSITVKNWLNEALRGEFDYQIPPYVHRMLDKGILISFNSNDFINPASYKGFCKLYKCNTDKPRLNRPYLGKGIGRATTLGFKFTDYDMSTNHIISSNIGFLHTLQSKMIEEFPEWDNDLYDPNHEYNRDWESYIGLSPQEKIVLANKHNEEPFPNSLYENDRGAFSKRVIELEHSLNEKSISNEIEKELGYDKSEEELNKIQADNIEDYYSNLQDGWDYGSWEMSDLYTRTKTRVEDFELYPVRVNCTPKAIRKRGKSPYDTKLGVRPYRWFNNYQSYIEQKPPINELRTKVPKYRYQMSETEKLEEEYDLPESYWEDLEKAYAQR